MENQATTAMLQAVNAAMESAKKAEREYDRGASEIRRLASKNIQLGVGTAVGKASEIAVKTRKVNDNYYATLQTLVTTLNDLCQPLLEQDPDPLAIRQVYSTIKWLNDESELKSTFKASVNGRSRGEIAEVNYAPTAENKMIEKLWQSKYEMHPKKIEAEKREQAEQKAKRVAAEESVKKKNQDYAAAYEEQLTQWNAKKGEILKKREGELQKALATLKTDCQKDIEQRYKESVKNANNAITFNSNYKIGHERKLAKLGFFDFAKKREEKEYIRVCTEALEQAKCKLAQAEALYQKENAELESRIASQKSELEKKIRAQYPMPKKPRKQSAYTDPQKTVDESTRQCIYDAMTPGTAYTVEDLMVQVHCLMDMQRLTVLGHLRAMTDRDIERIEENNCIYFRLSED